MRIVFDTNVFFAAFVARNGLCARVVVEGLASHEVFLSQFILSELARNLREKLNVADALVENAVKSLAGASRVVVPADVVPLALRDPDDAAILGTAIAAEADILVSGDKDLLTLGTFEVISILSPRQFYDKFVSEQP